MVGGLAAAFNLVSTSYGWTDKEIGELSIGRLRQITAAIQTQRYFDAREENARTSWMTRTLATYIAMGYMVEEGKENLPLEQATVLGYDETENLLLTALANKQKEAGTQVENRKGSFEALMGAFSPKRG